MKESDNKDANEENKTFEETKPKTRQRFMSVPAVTPLLPRHDSRDYHSKQLQERLLSKPSGRKVYLLLLLQ